MLPGNGNGRVDDILSAWSVGGPKGQDRLSPVDLSRRERHDHAPEVLSLDSEGLTSGLPSGSITVVAGYEGSGLMGQAHAAARSGDAAGLGRVFDAHFERWRELERAVAPEADPISTLDSVHPIIQVSFHGTPIAEGVVRDEGVCVVLPFAGGRLDQGGFAASTYLAPAAASPPVSTLVIVCQPELSDLERRALDRLPNEMSKMGLGRLDAGAEVARLVELRKELVLAGRQL